MSQQDPWPETPPTAPGAPTPFTPPPFTSPVAPPPTGPPAPRPPAYGSGEPPAPRVIRRAPTDRRLVVLSIVLAVTSLVFGLLWVQQQAKANDLQAQLDIQRAGDAASADVANDPPDLSPSTSTTAVTTTTTPSAAPTHVLVVEDDGCTVKRSKTDDEPWDLTWTVRDPAGFQVLGRSARGEETYRYFESGTYTVTLTTWREGQAHPVSNTVSITC